MVKEASEAAERAGIPSGFRGQVFRPGSGGYAEARRIFNMRRAEDTPALIARAADAEDVACVMRHASGHDLPVAIRAGGHGVDGSSMPDGGLVVDYDDGGRPIGVEIDIASIPALRAFSEACD